MSNNINAVIKLFFVTVVFAFVALVALIGSTLIFQDHIHPDDWKTTWQDVVITGTVVAFYIVYLYRFCKNHTKRKTCRTENT